MHNFPKKKVFKNNNLLPLSSSTVRNSIRRLDYGEDSESRVDIFHAELRPENTPAHYVTSEPLIKIFIFWSHAQLQRARSVLNTPDEFIKACFA